MSERPRVSLILPVFNGEKTLDVAVKSVLGQTLDAWELIIINDGSTDQTRTYLNSLSHSSIKVIHQANRGVSAARNAGLKHVTGEYITFLDADDVLPPRSLEARVDLLEKNPDIDVADGCVSIRDETLGSEIRRYTPYYRGPLLPRLLKLDSRVFFGVCYLFRRSIMHRVQFPEHMTHAEDLAFFMLLADHLELTYGHVDEVVYCCRSGKDSAMSNLTGLERGYLSLIDIVRELQHASDSDRLLLKLRIAKILLLSWHSQGETISGVSAAMRAINA